jgi:hypothetical protein
MGKRLILVLACALIVGLAVPAFAEVQNVKVSGDILVQSVARSRFDLSSTAGNELDDEIQATLSTVRLRVDADLTENVQAVVRLINERVWGELEETNTANGANAGAQDGIVELDLAYITLKEFLYDPLTLVIGRQNLRYGNALIVGDPNTNQFSEYNHYTGTQIDTIIPEDLSSLKAFDAVKAVLNYDPLVVDLVYAIIDEATVLGSTANGETDDVVLYGVNAAYNWGGDKKLEQEAYIFVKDVENDASTGGQTSTLLAGTDNSDIAVTLGTRASIEPIERLYLGGEIAWQIGRKYLAGTTTINGVGLGTLIRNRDAMAAQIVSQYAFDMKYNPVLMLKYSYYSGENDPSGTGPFSSVEAGDYEAWDPMFEDQAGGKIYNALFSQTNCNIFEVKTSMVPMEDLTVSAEYANLWLAEEFPNWLMTWTPSDNGTYQVNSDESELAQEIDLTLTYDYTEDVQFNLTGGMLMPGDVFKTNNDAASQVIGSVKVAF